MAGVLLGSATGLAQQPTPAASQKPNWDAIRKAALSALDRGSLQKWSAAQIDSIFTAEDPSKPGLEFYREIAAPARAADTAAPFKEGLSQILAEALVNRYQQAGGAAKAPLAPVFILMALRDLGPVAPALPAYQAVIADPAPAVRCQAATGIYALRAALAPAARTALIEPIRKAALAESNPIALARLYDFLKYVGDNPAQGQDVQIAQALIGILDARLVQVEKTGLWPIVPDAEAVNWLAVKSRVPALSGLQKDIARVTARVLVDAAYAYANNKPPQQIKVDLERITLLTEDPSDPAVGLADLLKAKTPSAAPPSPSLFEILTSATPDAKAVTEQKAKINAGIVKWIGADQTKGILNDAFGLPAGLGIQRPAPTTSTAPAS